MGSITTFMAIAGLFLCFRKGERWFGILLLLGASYIGYTDYFENHAYLDYKKSGNFCVTSIHVLKTRGGKKPILRGYVDNERIKLHYNHYVRSNYPFDLSKVQKDQCYDLEYIDAPLQETLPYKMIRHTGPYTQSG